MRAKLVFIILQMSIEHDPQVETTLYEVQRYWQTQHQPLEEARCWNALGLLKRSEGNLAAAQWAYRQGQTYLAHVPPAKETVLLASNLAVAVHDAGALDQAQQLYTALIQLATKLGLPRFQGMAHHNLGAIALEQNRLDHAAAALERSLAIKRSMRDTRGLAVTLHDLGVLLHRQHQITRARSHLLEALTIAERVHDHSTVIETLRELCMLDLSCNERINAHAWLTRAVMLCQMYRLWQTSLELGDVFVLFAAKLQEWAMLDVLVVINQLWAAQGRQRSTYLQRQIDLALQNAPVRWRKLLTNAVAPRSSWSAEQLINHLAHRLAQLEPHRTAHSLT